MAGVEVLATESIMESGWGVWVGVVIGLIWIIGWLIYTIKEKADFVFWLFLGALFGSLLALLLGSMFGAITCHETGEYRYKVTVDNSVLFNDFNDHYKIIKQDGKIFTVEEK